NIRTLRKALGQTPSGSQYIETVPRHGYRFVATVRQAFPGEPDLIIERPSRSAVPALEEGANSDPSHAAGDRAAPHTVTPPATARTKTNFRKRMTWLFVAVCLVALVAGAIFRLGPARPKQPQPGAPRTIAVLPFNPISVQGHDEYLELG